MTIISLFQKELAEEAIATRKMLSRIPTDQLDWQPHPKSMILRHLAVHIAELPAWITMGFNADGIDFAANPYAPTAVNSAEDIMQLFEENLAKGSAELKEENSKVLEEPWVLRHGEMVLWESNRIGVVRMAISQIIHHRAQLGVYLRLLNIPIPGSYGPSADEQ